MYAVIETGGKQYKVEVGDTVKVEKLENNVGDKLTFTALLVGDNGTVKIKEEASAIKVSAEVVAQGKNEKILVVHYRPKKHFKKTYGHRQPYTEIKILEIK